MTHLCHPDAISAAGDWMWNKARELSSDPHNLYLRLYDLRPQSRCPEKFVSGWWTWWPSYGCIPLTINFTLHLPCTRCAEAILDLAHCIGHPEQQPSSTFQKTTVYNCISIEPDSIETYFKLLESTRYASD